VQEGNEPLRHAFERDLGCDDRNAGRSSGPEEFEPPDVASNGSWAKVNHQCGGAKDKDLKSRLNLEKDQPTNHARGGEDGTS
jgi:hypothetical protein